MYVNISTAKNIKNVKFYEWAEKKGRERCRKTISEWANLKIIAIHQRDKLLRLRDT